jgi:hypothetical protein
MGVPAAQPSNAPTHGKCRGEAGGGRRAQYAGKAATGNTGKESGILVRRKCLSISKGDRSSVVGGGYLSDRREMTAERRCSILGPRVSRDGRRG